MARLHYSRQREAILTYLHSTTAHPTADTVYSYVKKDFPRISLGTVYRNLNLLSEYGDALKLSCGDGFERFDGNPNPHHHFMCTECGKVLDLDSSGFENMVQQASTSFAGTIKGYRTYFYGLCPECKERNN